MRAITATLNDSNFVQPRSVQDLYVDRTAAEDACRTLLRYIGENPAREGLVDTPARFVRALDEHFAGYAVDPDSLLQKNIWRDRRL